VTLAIDQTFFGYRIFGCGDVGSHAVLLTVTDQCGNSNTCLATVTVRDVTPPVITCPANVTTNASAGQCCATGVALGTATATDNCGAGVTNNAPSCIPVGTNSVVWTATDASGNMATCTQQVVVVDNQLPVINCPADVAVTIPDTMTCACDVPLGNAIASDNCGVSVVNNAPSCIPVGTNFVVWTATDPSGNVSVCTQRVTVATLSLSDIRIVAIDANGEDIALTWQTLGSTTNVIQLVTPNINGSYTNDYVDLDAVIVPGNTAVITNWVDYGGATTSPSRYYRIHVSGGAATCP
jgi:hypothetical protein